jgi:hypothetical protein
MRSDDTRAIVQAQMRSKPSQYSEIVADLRSDDPKRREAARSYLGATKTGVLTPALIEREWNKLPIVDKMEYRRMGITTPEQYAAHKAETGDGAPRAGQPTGLPMPSKKEDLKTGQVYETARGPARWDGKQFVSVQ